MPQVLNFLLDLMAEFAGGPGPPGNNLVRFGLAATLWFVLLALAMSRQREGRPARERLLVVGFALALLREIFKFAHLSVRLVSGVDHNAFCAVIAPLEHALTLAATVVIAGAFLRYILDDDVIARRYLRVGLWTGGLATAAAFFWWPIELSANPNVPFHLTWPASLLHLLAALLAGAGALILARRRGWLRNAVLVALAFLFVSELLTFVNFVTGHSNNAVLCPVANSFYLWAIPIFAFVYYREQTNEKRQVDADLKTYRNHLEELVAARTAELTRANQQLAVETQERIQTRAHAATLEERQRIAAEMHDGLAQVLGYLGLKSDEVTALLQAGEVRAAGSTMQQIRAAIGQASTEVRRSIASLNESPPAPQSLQNALNALVALPSVPGDPADPAVVFASAIEKPLFLLREEQEQVLRVIQEALANARKHAHATQISVELARQQLVEPSVPGELVVAVTDDGCGFDPGGVAGGGDKHFGLGIMAARAERLGGALRVASRPGAGTRVELRWPGGSAVDAHANGASSLEAAGMDAGR